MSTQPQISPLEQLGQDVANPQPQTTQSQSDLSPLEQLGHDVQKQQGSQQTQQNKATIAVPSIAGHMPGVMDFGNKVTPAQAAGGVAAGGVAGAIPLGLSVLPGAGEALLTHAEEQAGAWAAKYPHLVALGTKLGVPTAATALLGWMIHQAKSSSSK